MCITPLRLDFPITWLETFPAGPGAHHHMATSRELGARAIVTPVGQAVTLLTLSVVFSILTTLIIGLRVYVRVTIRRFGADDWLMCGGWVCLFQSEKHHLKARQKRLLTIESRYSGLWSFAQRISDLGSTVRTRNGRLGLDIWPRGGSREGELLQTTKLSPASLNPNLSILSRSQAILIDRLFVRLCLLG